MHNPVARLVTVIAAAVTILAVFVSYRSRTFHYCVAIDEQRSRLANENEPCRPDEQLMDWQDHWRLMGVPGKLRMLGNSTVEAFGR
jgi:hypothetical protein